MEDAVSSYSEELKNIALINVRDMKALVVNTEMLLFDIARDSKDPHFKVISKLVKEIRARD